MKFRHLLLALVIPALVCCKPDTPETPGDDPNQPETPVDNPPETNPTDDEELYPEVKNGDTILVTNETVEDFLVNVHYDENDYSFTKLSDYPTSPGNSDKPNSFTIRWTKDESAGDLTAKLSDATGWSRDFSIDAGEYYLNITNLLPNTEYTYSVKSSSGKVMTEGKFKTTGHVHQLFFRSRVRNCRDLGGWKTKDGKTVKYRMVYRGGRLEPGTTTKAGLKDVLAEGIKAQLDLRGKSDVLKECTLGSGYDFCAPVIEEGYTQLLKDDQEKCRQCIDFIFKCVRENKPVYYHCSLGRDRTGTISLLLLGILGVPEGDISQEYELTQFAPHGWATSEGEKTKMTRRVDYKSAATYIWGKANGGSFADGVENYLIEIGISKEDIETFRSNMLQ
jgi:protein-tyrosine phosphatase